MPFLFSAACLAACNNDGCRPGGQSKPIAGPDTHAQADGKTIAKHSVNVYYSQIMQMGGSRIMRRRNFLYTGCVGSCALAVGGRWLPATVGATPDSRIDILLQERLGTISPGIYGHFAEHLGGVIYDGIWVGENSKIANINGIRKSLVEEMRKIKAPVVRYPGGCFADSYDWRDGVGPVDKRPKRTNFWADTEQSGASANHKYEPNQFGTNEFVRFCKLMSSTLSCRECAQSSRRGILSLGGVLQFSGGQYDARGFESRFRILRALWGAILGGRKRILGLWRTFYAARIRCRIPPVHDLGAPLWTATLACGLRAERG
jgi:hypothetical protein